MIPEKQAAIEAIEAKRDVITDVAVINPVIENEAHYQYWLGALPFYNNVEREGIVIG